jgi:hypothetical protein
VLQALKSGDADLNRGPLGPEPSALPAALLPDTSVLRKTYVVKKIPIPANGFPTGATGLEPVISGVTGQRDNQLRYAPVMLLTIYEFTFCVKHLKSNLLKIDAYPHI